MRNYTPKELDWEYDREYLVYARPIFPDAFTSREDFQRKFDDAPFVSYHSLLRVGNFSGPFRTVNEVKLAMSHRRDVDRIIDGITAGTLPPPIILKSFCHYHLMSGNTRLAVASAMGAQIDCKVIDAGRIT